MPDYDDSPVFSWKTLEEQMERLRNGTSTLKPFAAYSRRIVSCDYLIKSEPRSLTRIESIRVWLEDLVDRAELVWAWSRVVRNVNKPFAVQMGDTIYAHPSIVRELRDTAR